MPTKPTPRLNRRLVLAEFFGCDYADLADARYQPTRFVRIPVYTEGDDFWCVTKHGEKPPAKWDGGDGTPFIAEWVAQPSDAYPLNMEVYAGKGLTIWQAK